MSGARYGASNAFRSPHVAARSCGLPADMARRFRRCCGADPLGWVEPTGPAFGRPDDKLRGTHPNRTLQLMGIAFAPPILRATDLQLKGRGQGQTLVDGFVVIELFDGTIKFFVDRNLRQIILHLFDAGHEVSKIKLLNW